MSEDQLALAEKGLRSWRDEAWRLQAELDVANARLAEVQARVLHCPACGDAGGVCSNCGADVVLGTPPVGTQAAR